MLMRLRAYDRRRMRRLDTCLASEIRNQANEDGGTEMSSGEVPTEATIARIPY